MGIYYHARSESGSQRAMASGKLQASFDGLVYLCDKPENALKFVALGCYGDPNAKVYVFEVELDDENVVETFDHSESFFGFRCYGHLGDIDIDECLMAIYSYNPWGNAQ